MQKLFIMMLTIFEGPDTINKLSSSWLFFKFADQFQTLN